MADCRIALCSVYFYFYFSSCLARPASHPHETVHSRTQYHVFSLFDTGPTQSYLPVLQSACLPGGISGRMRDCTNAFGHSVMVVSQLDSM